MTIQTMCNLAIKYGVCHRTIRRWYLVNRQIEDPLQAACQMLAETSTADLTRIIEILQTELNQHPTNTQ
jgi:hypothetical protein